MASESVIPLGLHQALIDVFKIQLGMDVKISSVKMSHSTSDASDTAIDCMSVLGLKSSEFIGSIALGFSSATFLRVLETMLGEKHAEVTDQNADACSELLNMIYASARVKINQDGGFDFQPAIPTAIRGHNLSIAQGVSSKFLRFKCESEKGEFLLALNLKRNAR